MDVREFARRRSSGIVPSPFYHRCGKLGRIIQLAGRESPSLYKRAIRRAISQESEMVPPAPYFDASHRHQRNRIDDARMFARLIFSRASLYTASIESPGLFPSEVLYPRGTIVAFVEEAHNPVNIRFLINSLLGGLFGAARIISAQDRSRRRVQEV